jgi:hypothetical protein
VLLDDQRRGQRDDVAGRADEHALNFAEPRSLADADGFTEIRQQRGPAQNGYGAKNPAQAPDVSMKQRWPNACYSIWTADSSDVEGVSFSRRWKLESVSARCGSPNQDTAGTWYGRADGYVRPISAVRPTRSCRVAASRTNRTRPLPQTLARPAWCARTPLAFCSRSV